MCIPGRGGAETAIRQTAKHGKPGESAEKGRTHISVCGPTESSIRVRHTVRLETSEPQQGPKGPNICPLPEHVLCLRCTGFLKLEHVKKFRPGPFVEHLPSTLSSCGNFDRERMLDTVRRFRNDVDKGRGSDSDGADRPTALQDWDSESVIPAMFVAWTSNRSKALPHRNAPEALSPKSELHETQIRSYARSAQLGPRARVPDPPSKNFPRPEPQTYPCNVSQCAIWPNARTSELMCRIRVRAK